MLLPKQIGSYLFAGMVVGKIRSEIELNSAAPRDNVVYLCSISHAMCTGWEF